MKPKQNVFVVWVRQAKSEPDCFDLKVGVASGKAFLRTASFTGVGSTPILDGEITSSLTTQELTQSSIIHVDHDEKNGRQQSEYQFASDTPLHLKTVDNSRWFSVLVGDKNILTIASAAKKKRAHAKQESPNISSKLKITKRQSKEHKNVSTYIVELESSLERSNRHIERLQKNVADLESQIEALGGTVAPTILDYKD